MNSLAIIIACIWIAVELEDGIKKHALGSKLRKLSEYLMIMLLTLFLMGDASTSDFIKYSLGILIALDAGAILLTHPELQD